MSHAFTDVHVDVYLDLLPLGNHTLMRIIARMGDSGGPLVHLHSISQIISSDGRDVTADLNMKNRAIMLNPKYITLIVDVR
jgi:hypothetical protein